MKLFKHVLISPLVRRRFPLLCVFLLLAGIAGSAFAAGKDGRRGQSVHRIRTGYHHYPRHRYYGGLRFYGYRGFWGHSYYGHGYYGAYPRYYRVRVDSGAIDLNVTPKKAAVYIDGQFLGKASKFDGFPDYLWLPKGTYDLVFYLKGYETVKKTFSIYPGMVFDLEIRLQPGEATAPEKVTPPVARNRDRLPERRAPETVEPRPQRESAEAPPQRYRTRPLARARSSERSENFDMRSKPATLWLSLEPADASVYLDGQFIGTGESLSRAPDGLLLDAGDHELEIIRPGYRTQSKTFQIGKGESLDLSIELEAEAEE